MNRRRMLMGTDRWAKEPLILYDGSANGYLSVVLNGAYSDKALTRKEVGIMSNVWTTGESWSIYIEDVKKYKTLYMTYKNLHSLAEPDEECYKDFGIATDENYGVSAGNLSSESGDFSVFAKLSGYGTSESTVSLKVEKLEGKKQLSMDSKFTFSGGSSTGIEIKKIWLE